ncbi:hypothetical protein GCM10017774_42470 [Lentzea cavernae]|uniref:Uncharacterized protein n=1 Tax=Lentzea cavernae TaxID=2020703 RepID=A0ABQ3MFI0_9PSEU|nr:hypothetical protein GCM10017774_42470 [Lentzea cavernae]
MRVPAGELLAIPFQLPLPWETPITAVGGQPLPRMTVGVRAELVIAGAPDKGDLDPILVGPLPSQDAVLTAVDGRHDVGQPQTANASPTTIKNQPTPTCASRGTFRTSMRAMPSMRAAIDNDSAAM